MSGSSEKEKMLRGELYFSFTSPLAEERQRCHHACHRFNNAGEVSRRGLVELWKDIVQNSEPLPAELPDRKKDEDQLEMYPYIEPPFRADYGTNLRVGKGVYINFGCTILDTCAVTIGDRCVLGPSINIYGATHPLDPAVRKGIEGPEGGAEIHIEDDCWIGGAVTILPGVRIGRGSTIGAGSVVVKSVPPFHVAAGNPAKVIKRIKTAMDPDQASESLKPALEGAEVAMAESIK